MQLTKDKQILIVGLGLLGGSYAEGLTESGYTVGAIDISDESIKTALSRGIIAHGETTVNSSYVGQFDLIILALYPEAAVQWMRDYQHLLKPNAIITDVTGVKCPVLYPIQSFLREDLEMIGAHPMAGKERSGVTFADAKMLRGANYIITPTSKNTEYAITLCRELGEALGFGTITCLSPEEHDEMIGFLSQLTHCIAVSLMTSRDTASFVDYSGDSFRDLTRIAKINEDMWSQLFLANKEPLLRQMDLFLEQFSRLRKSLADGRVEDMKDMMRLSTKQRKAFDIPSKAKQGEPKL